MPAYQARGIYVGMTMAELVAKRASARARDDGQIVGSAEAGQSFTKTPGLPPDQVVIEANYAIERLMGTSAPTRTRSDYGGSSDAPGCGYGCDPARSDFL